MGVKVKESQLYKRPLATAGAAFRAAGVKNCPDVADEIGFNPEHMPFKFQISPVRQILKHTRYGLYDETGVGKTLPCQLFLLLNCCLEGKSLILMPPNLIEQFRESFVHTFLGIEKHFKIEKMPTGPSNRTKAMTEWDQTGWPDILMMSYQMFLKMDETIQPHGYSAIAADEAHALKNPSSKTHKKFKRFIGEEGDSYVMLMTGTPGHNGLEDYYGLIKLVDPEKYLNKRSFEMLHINFIEINGYKKVLGYRNQPELSKRLYARARRVRKEQVYDLAEPSISEVPVRLDNKHMSLYKKLMRERVLEVKGELIDATNASSLRQKALQIVTNPHKFSDKPVTNEIHNTLDELLDDIGIKREKVILVCNYQETVRTLAKRYKKYNPSLAYGKSNTEMNRKKFLEDRTSRLMILHPKSGGAGLNLQSVCRYVIFVEPCSVPGDFKQTSDRVHRPGQEKHVSIYILKAVGTIAPSMTENMLRKDREVHQVQKDKTSVQALLFGATNVDLEKKEAA